MKIKLILAIAWMSLCGCERQQRSTVLTDESKRILDHFDFSNFDKQEALNYLDRQRYENQIRGKRSHTKCKRDYKDKSEHILDTNSRSNLLKNNEEKEFKKFYLKFHNFESEDLKEPNNEADYSGSLVNDCECSQTTDLITNIRNKRGHRSKKKHTSKSQHNVNEPENEEKKHRKKKKKKRKKRRYWDHWSEWSPCSVTCGRGRKIRWRKCIVKNCTTGELEMGEKTCQLPACNLLTKLLGL